MHIFWVAGLLLAFIDIPDFGGFLGRIAGSVERMAGVKVGSGDATDDARLPDAVPAAEAHAVEESDRDGAASAPKKPARVTASRKELDHA
jgi:hypothetical protein